MSTNDIDFSDTSIYDEIYGYIRITKVEKKIIDHPLFQRLGNIKQLGMACRVFPGAQHTRFSHSLGVMHVLDEIITSENLKSRINGDQRQKLRLAALLHDIGHYPLSHTIETVMTEHDKRKEAKHERFGQYIVQKTSIGDILKNFGYNPLEITQIFNGKSTDVLFNQLISSDLDADRLDYLLRDSTHTGVAYGKFDYNRLLHTLVLDKNDLLAVELGGKHAAEGYLIGRYHMWATVYTHKTINGFNELVQHSYEECLKNGKNLYSFDELKKLDENNFVKFDDSYLFYNLFNQEESSECLIELTNRLLRRIPLIIAEKAEEFGQKGKRTEKYHKLNQYEKPDHLSRLSKKSDVLETNIFHNNSKSQLPGLKPYIEFTLPEDEQEIEMQKALRIMKEDDVSSKPLVLDEDSIVSHLRNMSLDIVRIYTTTEDNAKKIRKVIAED